MGNDHVKRQQIQWMDGQMEKEQNHIKQIQISTYLFGRKSDLDRAGKQKKERKDKFRKTLHIKQT